MGVVVITIFITSFSFILLAVRILSSLSRMNDPHSIVLARITLISCCCLLSMLLTVSILIVYLAIGIGSILCEFDCAWRLRIVRDLFQLIYLIGVVGAFAVHRMQASTAGTTDKTPARNSFIADRGVENIIMDLAK